MTTVAAGLGCGLQLFTVQRTVPILRTHHRGPLLRAALLSLLVVVAPLAPVQGSTEDSSAEASIGKADFFKPGLAPVRENGPYDVTIVYFMDYQCPACRKFTPDVSRALKEDRRVRVIYRDTPIFGARSETAARLAIASQFQGRHEAFHHALMTSEGQLDEAALRAAADKAGVDWARLQRDLEARSDEIDRLIAWNSDLSLAAGISGTPAFVIGETLADGALDYKGLKAEIADARAAAGISTVTAPAPVAATEEPHVAAEAKEARAADEPATSAARPSDAPAVFEKSNAAAGLEQTAIGGQKNVAVWLWIAGLAGIGGLLLLLLWRRRRAA